MRGLESKVAVVTGAGGAIGRAIVLRLAAHGSRVLASDIDGKAAHETAQMAAAAGGACEAVGLDITDGAQVADTVARIAESYGAIDILINNAGFDVARQFLDTDRALWDKVIAVNLYGPLNMHHAVLPVMIGGGGGKVVNIASDAGRVGSSGESVYSACKGGIIAFTKTLARETARNNIRLNAIAPGPTDTPLFRNFLGEGEFGEKLFESLKRAIPLKRLGEPEDMAGIAAFLASDDADYITGQVISVSGGLTMHG